MRRATLTLLLALAVSLPIAARAAPVVLRQSGYLLSASDAPVNDPALSFAFRVYTTAGGTTAAWSATCVTAVQAGYYAVSLGDGTCGTALDTTVLPPGAPRWLEVEAGGTTLLPRLQLDPAPAAARALEADALQGHAASDFVLRAGDTLTGALALPANGLSIGTNQLVTVGGQVGIGSATPGARLDVAGGDVRVTGGKYLGDGSALTGVVAADLSSTLAVAKGGTGLTAGPTGATQFLRANGAGNAWSVGGITTADLPSTLVRTDALSTSLAGNLQLGTAATNNTAIAINGPNSPVGLTSAQDLRFRFASAGSAGLRAYRGSSWDTHLQFLTQPVTAGTVDTPQVSMTLDSNGNLGIGTTAPQTRLHVAGDLRTDGYGGKVMFHRVFTPALIAAVATNKDTNNAAANGRYEVTVSATGRKCFDLALVPAGVLSSTRAYSIRVEAQIEAMGPGGDSDQAIMVGDGTDLVGVQFNDSGNAQIGQPYEGADAATPALASFGLSSSMTTTGRGMTLLVRAAPGSSWVLGSRNPDFGPSWGTPTRVINPEQGLKVSLLGNDVTEKYGVYMLAVTVTEEGP